MFHPPLEIVFRKMEVRRVAKLVKTYVPSEQNKKRRESGGKMSRQNYDSQEVDKDFKMNSHHVPLRQIFAEIRPEMNSEEELLDES